MRVAKMSGRHERQRDKHLDGELLSAYLDGQVTAEERARVTAHLAGCAACADELRALRTTMVVLREMPPVPLPRAFTIPATAPAGRASLWDTLTRGWGYRALQGATALAMTLLMTLCAGDLLQTTLSTVMVSPVTMPLAGAPGEAYPTQTTDEVMLAVAPLPTTQARETEAGIGAGPPQTTAAIQPAAEGTVVPDWAPTPQTPAPQVAGAAPQATPTLAPPAPMAPAVAATTPSPSSAKASQPTPPESGRAQAVPSATATAAAADAAITATTPASLEYQVQTPSPAPPPQPETIAQPPASLARLAVCGVEGVLLTVAVGLLLVTGMAWRARRAGR